jgi:DNA-binding transcriptional MerR regulator
MKELYSIQQTSQLTGLTPLVIRAWENRYGVVEPERGEGNQRAYTPDQVQYLRLLSEAVNLGEKIGKIVNLSLNELEMIIAEKSEISQMDKRVQGFLELLRDGVRKLSGKLLEDIYMNAASEFGFIEMIDILAVPFLQELGEGWRSGEWKVQHEHAASAALKNVLANEFSKVKESGTGPKLLSISAPDQLHELGALAVAFTAAMSGFSTYYFGASMPAVDLVESVQELNIDVLMVSVVFPKKSAKLKEEMLYLQENIPESCRLFLGGPSASLFIKSNEDKLPGNLLDLKKFLRELRRSMI